MEVTLSIKELNEVFQVLNTVVPSRAVRPVLSYIYLSVTKETVTLTATDLEIGVKTTISDAQIKDTGETLLPASRLSAICHELKTGDMTIKTDDKEAFVKSDQTEYNLPLESIDDYPEIEFTANPHGSVDADIFSTMVRKTSFATATERSRFAINGVSINLEKGKLDMAATDGRRLANAHTQVEGQVEDFAAIVPARSLALVNKVVGSTGATSIDIEVDENCIIFVLPKTRIMARLITGRFPDYNAVIPKKNENKILIDKNKFEKIVRSVALVTSDESRSVLFKFSKDKLTTTAQTNIYGKSQVEERIDYGYDPLEIRFNPGYLLDGIKVCDTNKVRFSLKDGHSAVLIEEEEDKKCSYKYVVTPINVVT